jgi:hypothetical protein
VFPTSDSRPEGEHAKFAGTLHAVQVHVQFAGTVFADYLFAQKTYHAFYKAAFAEFVAIIPTLVDVNVSEDVRSLLSGKIS